MKNQNIWNVLRELLWKMKTFERMILTICFIIDLCLCCRDFRRPPALQGSPIHHYLLPAHQQPQMAAIPTAMSQYTPFSPTVAPPPAHQSPRHVQYTTHPLPAHVHPVLQSSTLPTGPYPTQIASQYGSLNPAGGIYATYPLSPTKGRSYQYFA